MKLAYKIVLGAGLLCIAFFICSYSTHYFAGTNSSSSEYIAFFCWYIIFSFLMIGFYHYIVIDRIKKIKNSLYDISKKHQFTQRLEDPWHDEISTLTAEINSILDLAYASNTQIEARVRSRTIQSKKQIDELEESIARREIVKKNILIHNENLLRMSRYDSLTNLPNHLSFNEKLNQSINDSKKHKKIFALIIIRFDNFKSVNDTLGRSTGDLVLKEMSERFKVLLRGGDTLARTGGAEFAMLLEDIVHEEVATLVAEKIIASSLEPLKFDYQNVKINCSVGIVLFPVHGASLENLQKNADIATFKANQKGINQYQFYNQEMNIESNKLIKLDTALRKAMENNEFVLQYQPKLDLKDGNLLGVEALLRWHSPTLGVVKPHRFIPLAEKTGFILQLGEWIFHEIYKIQRSWQEQGLQKIPIAINLSLTQFRHQDIVKQIETILKKDNIDPSFFEVEISSSTVMSDLSTSIPILRAISDTGVKIVIDEFGSGMTSLSLLKDLPISYLKIDKSFVQGIPSNENDTHIAKAIIDLANSLKINVIATGIETSEQCQFFFNNNCQIGQGYLFSKPMTEEDLILNYFGIS